MMISLRSGFLNPILRWGMDHEIGSRQGFEGEIFFLFFLHLDYPSKR